MGGKRIAGIVCFVLAAVFLISGILNVMFGPKISDASGAGAGHVVGSFLPSLVALIIGLVLFKKPPK